MGWLKKRPDPISDRERALSAEIAQLEERIKRLGSQVGQNPAQPKLRSTALPQGGMRPNSPPEEPPPPAAPPPGGTLIFEEMGRAKLDPHLDPKDTPAHYNDLGVRKYDLAALFARWRSHFQRPATNNPKLVNYLAAGGIQGLRPLRYEKRVARNRFIALVIILFLTLLGIVAVFIKRG
jgi:cell division protein FtsB